MFIASVVSEIALQQVLVIFFSSLLLKTPRNEVPLVQVSEELYQLSLTLEKVQ